MRKIITTTFVTLDGVMQAPGGPKEDMEGGFEHGGWSFGYWDNVMGEVMSGFMNLPFELLLGTKTYDIFAAFWPETKSDPQVATRFNATTKYVVSEAPFEPTWQHSKVITGDVVSQIWKLKEMDGPDLWVHGSGKLIQTLLAYELIDVMHIWTFPVTVGGGKRLFAEGARPEGFKMTNSKIATSGVIIATYEHDGPIKSGSFTD